MTDVFLSLQLANGGVLLLVLISEAGFSFLFFRYGSELRGCSGKGASAWRWQR
jgi:hypothetical protein